MRVASTRRRDLSAWNAPVVPAVDGPLVSSEAVRNPRTLMSALDEEDKKLELVKYLALGYRTSRDSPFGIVHFTGTQGQDYAATHHPLSWTAINHTLYSPSHRAFISTFPFFESPTVRAQIHVAGRWLKEIFDALPLGTIIAYPFSQWKPQLATEPAAKHIWRQIWAGWYRFFNPNPS